MITENHTDILIKLRKSVFKTERFKTDVQDEVQDIPVKSAKKTSNETRRKGYCR